MVVIVAASAITCISCGLPHARDGKNMIDLPVIADVSSIEVTVSYREGLELPAGRYDIGKTDWADTMKYMQPQNIYADTLNDSIYPIICAVIITCKDGTKQEFRIRWMGKNPLLISRDGLNWYWGTQIPDMFDTALGFVSFVKEHGKKEIGKEAKP